MDKKQNKTAQLYTVYKRLTVDPRHKEIESEIIEKNYSMQIATKRKLEGEAILISDKL